MATARGWPTTDTARGWPTTATAGEQSAPIMSAAATGMVDGAWSGPDTAAHAWGAAGEAAGSSSLLGDVHPRATPRPGAALFRARSSSAALTNSDRHWHTQKKPGRLLARAKLLRRSPLAN